MLSFDDITFTYPDAPSPVLDGVSFSVAPGECVALAGPNGGGKSTLARIACGFLAPDSGRVSVDGLSALDKATLRQVRCKVGIVFQDPAAQIVSSSVTDEVAFGPGNLGLPRDEIVRRVGESIRTCGLEGREQREPHTLSGGEQQRLAVAGVLAMRPTYLVLDEPCAMLDPVGRRELRRLVGQLRDQGHGILLITHDADEMVSADRVVVLEGGQVRLDGPPQLLITGSLLDDLGLDSSPMLSLARGLHAHGLELPARPIDPMSLAEAVRARTASDADGRHEVRGESGDGSLQGGSHAMAGCGDGRLAGQHGDDVPGKGGDVPGCRGSALPEQDDCSFPGDIPRGTEGMLEAHRVTYTYATGTSLEHRALQDVSVRLGKGEMVLVLGTTGSGKSTLLTLLSGLVMPDAGSVRCDGRDIGPGDVGLVFQRPERQLFADTVLDDVSFGPGNLGCGREVARETAAGALRQMGIDPHEYGQRSPFSLSGGEARRVAIAGIIAMHPSFVLFDEPSAGLDAAGRETVLQLISDLKERGCGVMVVSHDVDTFLGEADHVVLLEGGTVGWQGPARELVQHPVAFQRSGLELPGLLAFQRLVDIAPSDCSYDIDRIVRLVLGVMS
ncbi:MAG: ATP-binding cassette domain-containing protein [Coriobacteriales bacterium]|nr:ATP-binding cassette domain-containing protein [Coriobacteriales bacterium]